MIPFKLVSNQPKTCIPFDLSDDKPFFSHHHIDGGGKSNASTSQKTNALRTEYHDYYDWKNTHTANGLQFRKANDVRSHRQVALQLHCNRVACVW